MTDVPIERESIEERLIEAFADARALGRAEPATCSPA